MYQIKYRKYRANMLRAHLGSENQSILKVICNRR